MSLSISLLGPFAVTKDGQPVTEFRTDALRALLAVLALERGRPQRRESLAHLLSPDRPDKEAKTYLRNRLTRLRKTIGDDRAASPYLEINRKEIMLHEHVQVDVAEFDRLLDQVRHHSHRTLSGCPTCVEKLNHAAALYRGELLAGFGLENDVWQSWLTQKREQYKVQILDLLEMLSEVATVNREWEALQTYGRRQIGLDKWRESAYRSLMRASHALGERAEALGWYESCERILYEELGADPDGETLALKAEIEAGTGEISLGTIPEGIPDNLPLQITPFFGREAEKGRVIDLLVDPDYRLVTLVGEGGVGKTRLSLEVAADVKRNFPDGVWFVPLAEVNEGEERLKIAIGEALGLGDGKQLSGDQVLAVLRDKRLLLIFDNSETILDDLVFIPKWLQRAPDIVILASSREPLNFELETVIQLTGLPLGGERFEEAGAAVKLFGERGSRAQSRFTLTDENYALARQVCEMVGGSPLAIGLAAGWLRRRTLPQIVDSIQSSEKSLDFLTSRMRDTEPRHRSMRAVFETSWRLLEPEEQAVFAALSIFPGSFAEEAADEIAGASIFDLDILCEKSMLVQQLEEGRYLMHGLLRRFGEDKLGSGTSGDVTDDGDARGMHPVARDSKEQSTKNSQQLTVNERYIDYYYHFARRYGSDYAALGPEWDNFSVGIERAYQQEMWQTVLDYCQVLDEPWFRQARFTDMRLALEMAVDAAKVLQSIEEFAQCSLRLGEVEVEQNAYEVGESRLNEALMQFTRLEHGLGIAKANFFLGRINSERSNFEAAIQLFKKAKQLFEDENDKNGIAQTLNYLATSQIRKDRDIDLAEKQLKQARDLFENMPPSPAYLETLRNTVRFSVMKGDFPEAAKTISTALKLCQKLNDLGEFGAILYEQVNYLKRAEKYQDALPIAFECLDCFKKIGSLRWEGLIKVQIGLLKQYTEAFDDAERYLTDSLNIFQEIEDLHEVSYCYYYLYRLYDPFASTEKREKGEKARMSAHQLALTLNDGLLKELVAKSKD